MANYVPIAKEYLKNTVMTALTTKDWGRIFNETSANYEINQNSLGVTAVYPVRFPTTTAAESTSGALSAGSQTAVGVEITMAERNTVTMPMTAMGTLTSATPRDVDAINGVVEMYITDLNTRAKTLLISTIPDDDDYTHAVNASGAGTAVNSITAGYVYAGNDVSASETDLANVDAGDVLTPAIFRKMIATLRGNKIKPYTYINGHGLYACFVQDDQVQHLVSNSAFQANVNGVAGLNDLAIYGPDSFIYEGAIVIPVSDAYKASVIGTDNADTAHYAVFVGDNFIGHPYLKPENLICASEDVERMDLFGEAEIRVAPSGVDAPLYRQRTAAGYWIDGAGIVNPKAAIKLILHPDAS